MRKPLAASPSDAENAATTSAHQIAPIRGRIGQLSGANSSPRIVGDDKHDSATRYLRVGRKIRDGGSSSSLPHQIQGLLLPPCKQPTVINFEFKPQFGSRSRRMDMSSFLEGFPPTKSTKLESMMMSSASMNSIICVKDCAKEGKSARRKSMDIPRPSDLSLTINADQVSQPLTSPKLKDDGQPESESSASRRQARQQKIRAHSKTLAGNLNDGTGSKKKSKTKRPVTCGMTEASEINPSCTTRTQTPRPTASKTSAKKEKENLPPIRISDSQSQGLVPTKSDESFSGKCCPKCSSIVQKLQTQVQVTRSLQRQNGCLENIVTQKRNLVEQLTRQVRTLVRENQQLAKAGVKLPLEGVLACTDSPSSTTANIPTISVLDCTGSTIEQDNNNDGIQSEEFCSKSDVRATEDDYQVEKTEGGESSSVKSPSVEKLEEAEKQLTNLSLKCEEIQEHYEQIKKENDEINKFLTDLLYTLNARGYESIRDQEGNMIDLYRCRGEAFLDLKGRDVRLRIPTKKLAPQETLLKAVIGSQERIIQNLMCQLEDQQKDYMLARRFSSEAFNGDEGSRNSALEGDILTLLSLLEGACQRNPEIFHVLREQHNFDSQVRANAGISMGNAIVEAVLDRCQKVISDHSPPPRIKRTPRDLISNKNHSATPVLQSRLVTQESQMNRTANNMMETQAMHNNTETRQVTNGTANKYLLPSIKSDSECNKTPATAPSRLHQHQLPDRGRLPQINRGNSHSPMLNSNMSQRPVQKSKDQSNGSTGVRNSGIPGKVNAVPVVLPVVGTDISLPYLNGDRCPYCSRQFSSTASLAEINAHMELHGHHLG